MTRTFFEASILAAARAQRHHFAYGLLILIVLAAVIYLIIRLTNRRHSHGHHEEHWPTSTTPSVNSAKAVSDAAPIDTFTVVSPPVHVSEPAVPRTTRSAVTIPSGPFAVEVHGLTKRFGSNVAVDDVELLVPQGCAFGYLGPNGAGKTTLMRTLLGLTRADSGTISLLGMPVPQERQKALARVGAIVDEPRFFGHLSGRENLAILAATRGPGTSDRIAPSLDRVGLSERADHKVSSYSMGMRQRLGVASCLLGDPELLILDEPMNGLDPAGMHEMRSMIASLVGEGRTVMLSSHLLDEVERTCDAVAIVDHGRVIRQGSIDELIRGAGSGVLEVECSDLEMATQLLTDAGLGQVVSANSHLSITLAKQATRGTVAEINRRLVENGIDVYRLVEVRTSLEDWFLSVTSRFGESA